MVSKREDRVRSKDFTRFLCFAWIIFFCLFFKEKTASVLRSKPRKKVGWYDYTLTFRVKKSPGGEFRHTFAVFTMIIMELTKGRKMNRKLQIGLVKAKPQSTEVGISEPSFEAKTEIMVKVVERCIRKVAFGVAAYVVLDTMRKIAVEATKN